MGERSVKGYLTIYLTLTLMIMLSLCLTLIDGARRSCIRLEAECITDVAVYSVMAEYHREVLNQYNLFYIDSSYGGDYPSFYNTQSRLQYYLEQNVKEEECTRFDFVYKDLLGLELKEAVVERVAFATDEDGRRFQKRAAQVVLQDAGAGLVEEVLAHVGLVESHNMTTYDIGEELQDAGENIDTIVEKKAAEEPLWSMEIKTPLEYVETLIEGGVLYSVLEGESLSGSYVDLSPYISARSKRGDLNRGNADPVELSVAERILFHEYLLRYAGFYGQEKEEGLLKYQVEYLLGGNSSDKENLAHVVSVLLGIRSASNVIYLYGDSEKKAAAEAVATLLAAAVTVPELAPAFETVLLLGWAYVESLYDVKVLLAGGRVPLLKTSADWHYDLDSILEGVDMQVNRPGQTGLSYKDYLHVLLYLTDSEKLAFRFMDVMEMDIRQTPGNAAFRMDGCIEWLELRTAFCSRSGYKHEVRVQTDYE